VRPLPPPKPDRLDFPDHFSSIAAGYATSRPRYPDALFSWLASLAPGRRCAWDAGTGNGQAATALAGHFDHVIATDASAEQIAAAVSHPHVEYRVTTAERSGLATGSLDLVIVAQALHWFDVSAFNVEAGRVLRPGGVLAVWTYALPALGDPVLDAELGRLHDSVRGWWPAERRLVETGYRTLPFPFPEVAAPAFDMTARWDLDRFLSYVRTWSAVTRFREATGTDPVATAAAGLSRAWGRAAEVRTVRWPLSLRVGRLQRTARP
jgi:SAM-dependent methyltransferase